MKAEREKVFAPVTIVLETQEEIDHIKYLLNMRKAIIEWYVYNSKISESKWSVICNMYSTFAKSLNLNF